MAFFSSDVMILFFFSNPPTTRSTASRKSCFSTCLRFLRAALTPAWAGRLRAEIGWASLLPAVRRDHLHATLRARVPALALELDHG